MSAAAVKPLGPTMQPTPQKVKPTPAPREPGAAKRNGKLGPFVRVAISIVIVWHFVAIFLAALCIPDTSPLVLNLAQQPPIQWYLDLLYLNQGHAFFAPDVGPSHVVHYELFDQSGRPIGDGHLPSKKDHWPRLRYHRHFMLADQAPANDPTWGRIFLEAYARQLLRANPEAQAVRVRHYAHWPLPQNLELLAQERGYDAAYQEFKQDAARNGVTIDEQGYQLLLDATQRRTDLPPEESNASEQGESQSNAWQSGPVSTAGRWQGGPR
jgi:hypothetical protein